MVVVVTVVDVVFVVVVVSTVTVVDVVLVVLVPEHSGALRQFGSSQSSRPLSSSSMRLSQSSQERGSGSPSMHRGGLPSQPLVAGLLADRHHSIATNFAPPGHGVASYGLVDATGDGFPHGFEVQVVGPSSARQTLLHLVVTSTNRRIQYAWSDVQIVIDTRDV